MVGFQSFLVVFRVVLRRSRWSFPRMVRSLRRNGVGDGMFFPTCWRDDITQHRPYRTVANLQAIYLYVSLGNACGAGYVAVVAGGALPRYRSGCPTKTCQKKLLMTYFCRRASPSLAMPSGEFTPAAATPDVTSLALISCSR